jgi:hypothetical protein
MAVFLRSRRVKDGCIVRSVPVVRVVALGGSPCCIASMVFPAACLTVAPPLMPVAAMRVTTSSELSCSFRRLCSITAFFLLLV